MRRGTDVFIIAFLLFAILGGPATRATPLERHDCYSKDVMRRIEGCTELLKTPTLAPQLRAHAFGMRALALSLIGRFSEAVADYDKSLSINPSNPVTLNNRAWALYKMGRIDEALPDVEKSLRYDSLSQHAFDTRAHLWQAKGQSERAYRDYRQAMDLGGAHMIRLYQCGLQAYGLYQGPMSGIFSQSLDNALRACVKRTDCDPLPPDEECKAALS
jgi:tetratricopeptide (TPR) repeat protein